MKMLTLLFPGWFSFETGVDNFLVANANRVDVSECLRHNMKEMSWCDDCLSGFLVKILSKLKFNINLAVAFRLGFFLIRAGLFKDRLS